jgi:murein DD-endopeptidase MepM/ murein hydrolase activator NlpD
MRTLFCWLLLALTPLLTLATAQVTHTVQRGDTLTRIATRYGLQVEDVAAANGITDTNLIELGQTLLIPIASATPAEQLPWPFTNVEVRPGTLTQGHVARVHVDLDEPAAVSVRFLGSDLAFAPTGASWQAANVTTPTTAETNTASTENSPTTNTPTTPATPTESPLTLTTSYRVQGVIAASVLQDPGVYDLALRAELANGDVVDTTVPVQVVPFSYRRESINLDPETSRLLDPNLVANERARIASLCDYSQAEKLWEGMFSFPVTNPIETSPFGTLRSYNGGPFRSFHGGLDLRANSTIPIYAPARGEVVLAAPLSVRGNTVVLRHGLGVCSLYTHLSTIDVSEGATIEKGTLMGYGGDTGLVTGPHLHWEIRIANVPVDPAQWANQDLGLE